MIFGNYINESYDRFYILDQECNNLIQGIKEDYDLLPLDEGIDFGSIIEKIADAIIQLVGNIRRFITMSIDKLRSMYADLLKNINKDTMIKHNVRIADYGKVKDTDDKLKNLITKAEDNERKLMMNKYDEQFIQNSELVTGELKDAKFDYSIIDLKNGLDAERYYNAGEVIGNIKKVFDMVIASKNAVLAKLPQVETLAKNAKKTLKIDKEEHNEDRYKGNKCSVDFFNAFLLFLTKSFKMYKAIDVRLMKDMKLIHKNSHDNIITKVSNYISLYKSFKNISGKFPKNVEKRKNIKSEEEYNNLTKWHKIIYETENYEEYKAAFANIASYFGVPAKEIIIQNLEFRHKGGEKGFGDIYIRYAIGLAKVKLPAGTHLIHSTPAELPGYVEGAFRSRVNGKYFYPEKRIFFTVERLVDATQNGTEGITMDVYVTKDTYSSAYLDPSCPGFGERCVMLMTDEQVPVKKVSNIDIANKDETPPADPNATATSTEESTIMEGNLFEDNFYKLASNQFLNEEVNKEELKKFMNDTSKWSTANSKQRMKVFYNNTLDEEEYIMLRKCIKTINESKTYQEYLPAFNKLCRFCSILPEHVIISKYTLKNQSKFKNKYSEGTYSIYVEYYHNNKKITLPEGTKLFHISKVPNIRSLKPFFKGKSERGYIYDKPRIYLTVYKNMPRIMADYKMTDKLYKYQVTQDIKTVYVDPMVWMNTMGAVYIETKNEIPVELVKTEGFSIL